MLSAQKTTLCAPLTFVHVTTSPTWIVMLAGAKRLPFASPII